MKHAKQCPKCGGSAVRTITSTSFRGGWSECLDGECRFTVYAAEGDPVTKWNEIAEMVEKANRGSAA